jgi:3'-phosphoadenosine 5'-phosphosulfate sulfotransferase (PAPS reductase)/FAD synthetase
VVERDGTLIMVDDDRMPLNPAKPEEKMVRFRTLGCYPLTGAVESDAPTLPDDHPGNAADHHVRAPGPRDRPRPVRLDGKEKAGGLLLMATESDLIATDIEAYLEGAGEQGPAAVHHLRQRRRRQVDADRPPALRHPS